MSDEEQIPLTEILRSLSPREFANLKPLSEREIEKAIHKYDPVLDGLDNTCYVESGIHYR